MAGAMGLTAAQTAILAGAMQAGITTLVGQATANSGQQLFFDQLAQNVKAGVATAMIGTAINGGSLDTTIAVAALMSGVAVAIAGGDASELNLGSQAGGQCGSE